MKTLLYGILVYALLLFVGIMAHAHNRPRDAKLQRCYVYVPDMRSAKLRKWCLKQSEWMP